MAAVADSISSDNEDEDYIDMEVSSNAYPKISSPHPSEFEFHMYSGSHEREAAVSWPADELFYNGKLLPLLHTPRLQMVEKFLQCPNPGCRSTRDYGFEDFCSTPLVAAMPTGTRTPSESCSTSPLESCRVSRELIPEDHCVNCSTEASAFISDSPKKSWIRKLKLMKQFPLSTKLKASRAYLKSLSSKSGCSHQPNAADQRSVRKAKENLCVQHNEVAKYTFGQNHKSATVTESFAAKEEDAGGPRRRRSFSVMFKRCLPSNSASTSFGSSSSSASSSSSSSGNSNGCYEPKFFKRSNSASSEMERSLIQGAIAHCKLSQKLFI